MLLYHYTSLETFFKIFNTKEKKITFWATNAYYMNDPKEIEYSFKLFIDSLEFFEEETVRIPLFLRYVLETQENGGYDLRRYFP